MGWYPNMFMAVLNLLTEGSFGVLACLSGGQALNVVFKDHLSVAGGIVVVGIAAWLVATAGFKYIQWYQKWVFHLPTSCSI
jgi:purine-cytosine permease-like protein